MKIIVFMIVLILVGTSVTWWWYSHRVQPQPPIKVGILHSLTGLGAGREKAGVDATLMAIEEINHRGGILGRQIQPVIADGKSDWPTFAQQAEHLITQEKVGVVFGCWTSASRKSVKPVFEKYNHLLIYPVQYEGLEASPNIVYLGAAPNQQILPAVAWCFENIGKKFFFVGSDYVFPRAINEIAKEHIRTLGGTMVGEEYVPMGSAQVDAIVAHIVQAKPDVVLHAIVNEVSNIPFFKALRAAGITPEKIPIMSFTTSERDLMFLDVEKMVGDYATGSYFHSIHGISSEQFLARFKNKYGKDSAVGDPVEAAYFGVYLWAQAVQEAGTDQVDKVHEAIKHQSYLAPEGIVSIDPVTQHTWKFVRIGKITAGGKFSIVWDSRRAIRPLPYPVYRDKAAWEKYLMDLYEGWGKQWVKA